ncbi:MAG: hypothetical protein RL329_1996, partial [Bacteroidota bacterium]
QGSGLSLPLQQEQLLFSTEKQVTKIAGETGKSLEVESNEGKSEGLAVRKAGRPKGRKNKSHTGAISDLVPCQTESKSKTPKGVLKAKGRPKGRKNKTQSSGSELKSPKKVQKRLSHFKNIKEQQVTNVIGNAFFRTTLSNLLLFEIKQIHPTAHLSIQDLKAFFRAEKYLTELLNMDEFKSSVFLNLKNLQNMPLVGAINPH